MPTTERNPKLSVPPGGHGDVPLEREVIRVFLVEDNRLLREGIVTLLNGHPQATDITVVASAACSQTALPEIRESAPGVVLVDAGLGDDDSLILVDCIARTAPAVAVIVMDLLPDREEITSFSDAGAAGFIMKDATTDEVFNTIRTVAAGGKVVPNGVDGSLLAQIARQAAGRPLPGVVRSVIMTKRERRIIALISEGMSNRGIARLLHLSAGSIRGHVRSIVGKLALRASLQSEIDFLS